MTSSFQRPHLFVAAILLQGVVRWGHRDMLGSTSDQSLRQCAAHVCIVKSTSPQLEGPTTWCFATDDSPAAHNAFAVLLFRYSPCSLSSFPYCCCPCTAGLLVQPGLHVLVPVLLLSMYCKAPRRARAPCLLACTSTSFVLPGLWVQPGLPS